MSIGFCARNEGFGVLTEIDVRALEANADIGLLLPCNVGAVVFA